MFGKKNKAEKRDPELVKLEQEQEQKMKIKKAFAGMDKFISECDAKANAAIAKARASKDSASLKIYKMGIATAIASKNRAEKMKATMDALLMMSEISKMTTGFLDGMGILAKELNDATKMMEFGRVDKVINEAMFNYEKQSGKMEDMFDRMSESFESVDINIDGEMDAAIDKLIAGGGTAEMDDISSKISERLEKLKGGS